MEDNGSIIDFFNRNDADADKYRVIDEFLKLSKRFSKNAIRRKTIITYSIGAFMIVLGAAAWIMSREFNTFEGFMILFGFIPIAFCKLLNGSGYIPEVERAKLIISQDGIDTVYGDLLKAKYIRESELMVGKRYLFGEGNMMVRLKDIKGIYKHTTGGKYPKRYAMAEVIDESGTEPMKLETLPSFGMERRMHYITDEIMRAAMMAEN